MLLRIEMSICKITEEDWLQSLAVRWNIVRSPSGQSWIVHLMCLVKVFISALEKVYIIIVDLIGKWHSVEMSQVIGRPEISIRIVHQKWLYH